MRLGLSVDLVRSFFPTAFTAPAKTYSAVGTRTQVKYSSVYRLKACIMHIYLYDTQVNHTLRALVSSRKFHNIEFLYGK